MKSRVGVGRLAGLSPEDLLDALSPEQIDVLRKKLQAERSARQLSQKEKAQRATYVVSNDGSVADLESKLSAVLDMLGP